MSFSFNFELTEEDCGDGFSTSKSNPASLPEQDGCDLRSDKNGNDGAGQRKSKLPAFEVKSFYGESVISKLITKTFLLNEHALEIVDTSKLEQLMLGDEEFQSSVCKSTSLGDIITHSDLVDGVYEGGLKVWECGVDLATFLSSHTLGSSIKINEKRVLELGCGAGLPGLCCIKCGATCVDFQDYNEEVLKLLTHTNVVNNIDVDPEHSNPDCHYFAGDWEEFCELNTNQPKYDLILSAETIYNVENYPKLHKVCDKLLTTDGVVLIAAKEYYFGVGGGVDSFLEYLNDQKCFDFETVWETKTGVPRKILMLKRRQNATAAKLKS